MEDSEEKKYYQRGLMHMNNGEYQRAIDDLTEAIKLSQGPACFYRTRGTCYAALNEHQQAIDDFTTCIEHHLRYVKDYDSHSGMYTHPALSQRQMYSKTKLVDLHDPKYVISYYKRGVSYTKLRSYQNAIDDFSKTIELDPELALVAYESRGNFYAQLNEHQYAIRDYTEAIKLDPKFLRAYYNRGISYVRLGNHQQAIDDFTSVTELNPKFTLAYYNRACTFSQLKEHKKAIRDYTATIRTEQNYAPAYFARGVTYSELGKHQKAIDDFTTIINNNKSNHTEAYSSHIPSYARFEAMHRPLDCAGTSIGKCDSKLVPIYYNRGKSYAQLGEHQLAIDDYTSVIKLAPKNRDAYHTSRNFYAMVQRLSIGFDVYARETKVEVLNQAVEDLNNTIDRNSAQYLLAYYNRGKLYAQLREHQKAVDDYTAIIDAANEETDDYYHSGISHQRLEKLRKVTDGLNAAFLHAPNVVPTSSRERDHCIKLEGLRWAATVLNTTNRATAPPLGLVYYKRGDSYVQLFESRKAIDDCTSAIKLDPKLPGAYYSRGLAYCERCLHSEELQYDDDWAQYDNEVRRDFLKAINDFTQAIEHDPKNADTYYHRGRAYAKIGEDYLAINDYTVAIKLKRKNSAAFFARSEAYRRLAGGGRIPIFDRDLCSVKAQDDWAKATKYERNKK